MREKLDSALDNVELGELYRIYQEICFQLEIGADHSRRDEVAAVVMDIAQGGERDYDAIRKRTVIKLTSC